MRFIKKIRKNIKINKRIREIDQEIWDISSGITGIDADIVCEQGGEIRELEKEREELRLITPCEDGILSL